MGKIKEMKFKKKKKKELTPNQNGESKCVFETYPRELHWS
jgi:hypothetical protein